MDPKVMLTFGWLLVYLGKEHKGKVSLACQGGTEREVVNGYKCFVSRLTSAKVSLNRNALKPIVQNSRVHLATRVEGDLMPHVAQGINEPPDRVEPADYILLVSAFIVLYAELGLYLYPLWVAPVSLSTGVLAGFRFGIVCFQSSPEIRALLYSFLNTGA